MSDSDALQPHREEIARAVSSGGEAVAEYIRGIDSDPLRRVLYLAARGMLNEADTCGDLDDLIAVADEGVAEMLRQAATAQDDDARSQCLHGAHVVSYNLAADLADCWPEDLRTRSRAHHERGVQAANECLTWSEPTGMPKAICKDYWARGIHEFALGDISAAIASWRMALDHAAKAAALDGMPVMAGVDSTFLVNLTSGYLGLARWAAGDSDGRSQYEHAISTFESQLGSDSHTDAEFGIGQLNKARSSYSPLNA